MLGGAGITLDHTVMRHMNNLETVLTYEGTEEMHLLTHGPGADRARRLPLSPSRRHVELAPPLFSVTMYR